MERGVIERDESLLVMAILGDIRAELQDVNDLLRGGDDDGDEEAEEDT